MPIFSQYYYQKFSLTQVTVHLQDFFRIDQEVIRTDNKITRSNSITDKWYSIQNRQNLQFKKLYCSARTNLPHSSNKRAVIPNSAEVELLLITNKTDIWFGTKQKEFRNKKHRFYQHYFFLSKNNLQKIIYFLVFFKKIEDHQ